MELKHSEFEDKHLKLYLQYAVELELWTIPFYMSAMYSVIDRSSKPYQLIRSIVNQEMLHLQSAANIANAFGYSPDITTPVYCGTTVPHLDFSLDPAQRTEPYMPYTAEIGPLDEEHINAMCLIELPDFGFKQGIPKLFEHPTEFGTIAEFYQALLFVIKLNKHKIRGGVNQVDYFAPFYRNAPDLIVTESGNAGLAQIELLIELITEQGEGYTKDDQTIPHVFQNTADDPAPDQDHFQKFKWIKEHDMSETFALKEPIDDRGEELQQICMDNFAGLIASLNNLFSGAYSGAFFPCMAGVGGAIRNCWQNGVVPKFSDIPREEPPCDDSQTAQDQEGV